MSTSETVALGKNLGPQDFSLYLFNRHLAELSDICLPEGIESCNLILQPLSFSTKPFQQFLV